LSPVSPELNNETQKRAGIFGFRPALSRGPFPLEPLASVATIVGTLVSILGLMQSQVWLVLTSLLFVCVTIFALNQSRKVRLALQSASTVIEGRSIDSLNIANLRRRVNSTLVIQEAHHTARIESSGMEITWRYIGYCKVDRVSAMEFSIDSEAATPFDDLNCLAFDLGHDPEMKHPISPLLLGTSGLSKKISVPFLEPLSANQPFSLSLKCTLPRCLTPGFGYYTSTLSFAQKRVSQHIVNLIFVGTPPEWVRVYESSIDGALKLVKTLRPSRRKGRLTEYEDRTSDRRGQSARVYSFWRKDIEP
jgi:hypothetical protein